MTEEELHRFLNHEVKGVRFNVVRRPLSGGKGSIRPHAAKSTKTKFTPAETDAEFYERLRVDYLAAEPEYWFFRAESEVSAADIQKFKDTCFDPILQTMHWWYNEVTDNGLSRIIHDHGYPPTNYRMPFGVYNSLMESGATEYDNYLETGSTAGLHQTNTLFPELQ